MACRNESQTIWLTGGAAKNAALAPRLERVRGFLISHEYLARVY